MTTSDLFARPVAHVDDTAFDATPVIRAMGHMSFSARNTAIAAELLATMMSDTACTVVLSLAESAGAAGCLRLFADMVEHNIVEAIVSTGAAIVDMDFFEALGFRHYHGSIESDDVLLRSLLVDRIYDTYIDEAVRQRCDRVVADIADSIGSGVLSSRPFTDAMGAYLRTRGPGPCSRDVPCCPRCIESRGGTYTCRR